MTILGNLSRTWMGQMRFWLSTSVLMDYDDMLAYGVTIFSCIYGPLYFSLENFLGSFFLCF